MAKANLSKAILLARHEQNRTPVIRRLASGLISLNVLLALAFENASIGLGSLKAFRSLNATRFRSGRFLHHFRPLQLSIEVGVMQIIRVGWRNGEVAEKRSQRT
jgi:hypothetical protein